MEEAPDAYAVDDHGLAHVLDTIVGGALDVQLLAGARACPVEAIRIYESATGRRVHP